MKHNFEDWLEYKFIEDYTGIKDDASDAFDNWLAQLDVQELIDYANEWMQEVLAVKEGKEN